MKTLSAEIASTECVEEDSNISLRKLCGGVPSITATWENYNGEYHRLDGPSIEWKDGCPGWWYRLGKKHRTDGPAITYETGKKEWWVDGKKVATKEVNGDIALVDGNWAARKRDYGTLSDTLFVQDSLTGEMVSLCLSVEH